MVIRGDDARFGQDYEVDAYLPDPLPREVELSDLTWTEISDAMKELGSLDAAAMLIPDPSLLVRVATRVEAVGTSALEGTYADLTEVFAADADPGAEELDNELPADVKEVVNFIRAADLAYAAIADSPITKGLLSSLQAELVKGTSSDGHDAGRVRTTQVFIGPKHRPITEARFVPPPPGDQLEAIYDDWFEWVRDDRNPPNLQVLVHTAVAHYQFETIHPYYDGNGRLGRLAVVLQMMRHRTLVRPVLSISPWLNEHKDEYKDHLFNVSLSGEWEPWVRFFAIAVGSEAKRSRNRISRLLELKKELSAEVRGRVRRGRLAIDLVDDIIEFPIVSVALVERRYEISNQAARNAISRLVDEGLLEPFDDLPYGRRFWNPRVFQALANSE